MLVLLPYVGWEKYGSLPLSLSGTYRGALGDQNPELPEGTSETPETPEEPSLGEGKGRV